MKKQFRLIIAMTLLNMCLQAQISNLTNGPGIATDYVGWNAAQAFPLTIHHKGNQPVLFGTNGPSQGFVGIGGTLKMAKGE